MNEKTEIAKARTVAALRQIADGLESGTLAMIPHGGITLELFGDSIGVASQTGHGEYRIDLLVRTAPFIVEVS